eukprot:CAMPEP_0172475620 /NCGR_PEP_ID=MMETSP1065-20121228/69964_1 /TAXON_ID=265537 /ORGANISM="Amphiprora paludosa, Strain CCMP125" /LENGTH=430 /DNA_ID=CAMNT_0013233831 /DNA_START=1078 /DNA_END=2370 /DNA_ORIENTATION=-
MLTVHSNNDHATSQLGAGSSEELRAANALLETSSVNQLGIQVESMESGIRPDSYAGLESLAEQANAMHGRPRVISQEESAAPPNNESLSGALDALATLASEARSRQQESSPSMHLTIHSSNEHKLDHHLAATGIASPSSSEDEDSHDMPPPVPRRRPRSCSNPEGMEKWDSLNQDRSTRRHFVLPASILEEELAEASAAIRRRKLQETAIPEEPEGFDEDGSPSPDCVVDHPVVGKSKTKQKRLDGDEENQSAEEEEEEEVVQDDSNLTPDELLKRARSRLLEDLSEGSINGDKGVLTLPHSLGKYKEVYNRNGRIGIYTPSERAAIIARFNKKRQRRVWNKKIRYGCRKNLADRRLRVKGRFVKRSEQELLAKELQARVEKEVDEEELPHQDKPEEDGDEEMPDVSDPDAGFVPTEDQPFRRLRRHTIT